MFVKRLISGALLLIFGVAFVYIGDAPLLLLLALISIIGQFELYRALSIERKGLTFTGFAATVAYYALVLYAGVSYITTVLIISLIVMMAVYVVTFPEYRIEDVTSTFFGFCYVSVMLSYIYLTRDQLPNGIYFAWLIFISAWGNDTFAYCTGMLLGKHKLVPKLSPKKSIEGAIGGVVGAMLLGAVYGKIVKVGPFAAEISVFTCAAACGTGAVIAMIGDLAASAIKRDHAIKDYGDLIPGHGGILDRFDSMIFTAPAVYYAVRLLEDLM